MTIVRDNRRPNVTGVFLTYEVIIFIYEDGIVSFAERPVGTGFPGLPLLGSSTRGT